jgi:hypothetical protein
LFPAGLIELSAATVEKMVLAVKWLNSR